MMMVMMVVDVSRDDNGDGDLLLPSVHHLITEPRLIIRPDNEHDDDDDDVIDSS